MNSKLQNLLEKLQTSEEFVEKVQASIHLVAFGSEAVEPLINIVQDENKFDLWSLAVDALGRIGDKRAVEPLINLLKNPISFDAILARKYTAYALAQLPDVRALDVLIEMLHERSHSEDEEDDGTITIYDEVDYETIEAAVGALAKIGEWRGIQAVIDRFLEGDFWCDCRMGEWGGEAAFQYIVSSLKTDDLERQSCAASLLGEFGDKRAVPILTALLDKQQPDKVRHSAAYGLAQLHTAETLSSLLLALADPYEQTQLHAAHGIFYLINKNIQLNPDEPDLPTRIQQALKQIGEEKLVAVILELIHNSSPRMADFGIKFLEAFEPYMTAKDLVKSAWDTVTEEQRIAAQKYNRPIFEGFRDKSDKGWEVN